MSPRVLNKESVPRRFREKPFVVPKASAVEGKKKGQGGKNLSLNYLLILRLFSRGYSVKLIHCLLCFAQT